MPLLLRMPMLLRVPVSLGMFMLIGPCSSA